MKIAVIGATGFLGSNIIKFLSKKYKIIATYNNKNKIIRKYHNIRNIKWKFLDIYKKKKFFKYLEHPDIVIHLAWSNLPNYKRKYHIKKELPKQKKFIFSLINNGLKNIFIAGTCFEYGLQNGKLNENIKEKPNNNYSLAKYLLKKYIFSLKKKYNFNLTWGRIFYVYGKHNSRHTLFNQLLYSSKKNIKLNVNGNLIRDYLHIDQVSKIIVNLCIQRRDFGVLNICSGKGVSLKKLIKNICKKNKLKLNINYKIKIKNSLEPNKFWGCNKKLKNCLGKNAS